MKNNIIINSQETKLKRNVDGLYIRLKKLQKLDNYRLSLKSLKEIGIVNGNIQGVTKSIFRPELFEYINSIFYEEYIKDLSKAMDAVNQIPEKYSKEFINIKIEQDVFRKDLF